MLRIRLMLIMQNLARWARALLGLAQYQQGAESEQMISDATSKLEEALTWNPKKKPDVLWCLGNAHTSYGLFTTDMDAAALYFEKATTCFKQASDADPSNDRYRKSLEVPAKTARQKLKIYPFSPGTFKAISGRGTVIMASSSSSGLTCKLHPLVILNVSDHYTRVKSQPPSSNGADSPSVPPRVFGCVIGIQSGRTVKIFKLLYDPATHSLDRPFLEQELYKKVFPNLYVLGWHS